MAGGNGPATASKGSSGIPDRRLRPRSRYRVVAWLVAGFVILIIAWLVGSYWLLNSHWLPQRLSQLDGIEIRWESGHSRHPGRWDVEGFHLAREDDELALSVDAERATLELSLLALLRGELHIRSLDAHGIRRLTLNDLALEGDGSLLLQDTRFTARQLEISHLALRLDRGLLQRQADGAVLVRDIALTGEASLTRTAPTEVGADLLEALSGHLQLDAHADAWDVFTPYLDALPWLALSGYGRLQGDLTLARGLLAPGSTLRLDSPALRVEVDESRWRQVTWPDRDPVRLEAAGTTHNAAGEGDVVLRVPDDHPERLTLTTRLRDVALADATPYASRASLTFAAELDSRRLDRLEAPTRARLSVSGDVIRLDMLDPYLQHALDGQSVRLRGAGQIEAEFEIRDARPSHARAEVRAPQLQVSAIGYEASGGGWLRAGLDDGDRVTVDAVLEGATLHHQARQLLADAELRLSATGPFDPKRAREGARAEIVWRDARLPDIGVLQPYLTPFLSDPAPLLLLGGGAQSQGELEVTANHLRGALSISGEKLRTQVQAHILESDMHLTLVFNEVALDGERLDIGGSRLRWQARGEGRDAERLESDLLLREGRLRRRDGTSDGQFVLEGTLQQLGFLNAFLPDAHGLAVQGNGQLHLRGAFEDQRLLPGAHLRVEADQLEVRFLDHQAAGSGELTAQWDTPELVRLSLAIPQYSLQRQDDDRPHLEGRDLVVTTRTEWFSEVLLSPEPQHFTTHISLPMTEVPDFTRYNDYLPENAGVTLLGGRARLSSEFTLVGLDAHGALTLRAADAELALLDQQLRGDLHLALQLREGDLATRQFNADHSFLRLDHVQRQDGERRGDADWWVQLDFDDARLRWTEQITLVSRVGLAMRDTGLLARLFLSRARDSDWLGRLLDVRDIEGSAQLDLNDARIRLSDVDLRGENLTLLADLALAEGVSNGALYARLGALALGVELNDSEPTLRIVRPRRWFDAWRAAGEPPR